MKEPSSDATAGPLLRRLRTAPAALAVLAFAAYLPALFGGFVYDDQRFVEQNPAIRSLSPARIASFFTEPKTMTAVGHEGIYRPLRTLDFAIDWAISGGRPWWFHLRNVAYHVAAVLLLFALLRRVLGPAAGGPAAAFLGAAVFALHPVNVESVAFITSRGDLLLLVFFLGALYAHVRGRPVLSIGLLLGALLSKEAAVVFPAAAWLVDRLRGERIDRRFYAAAGAVVVLYAIAWTTWLAGGDVQQVGHLGDQWWGGSYDANLVTMTRGFAWYVKLLFFPTGLVIDYHVPAHPAFDVGAAVSLSIVVLVALAALLGGPRSRFALLWFLVAILPSSNLIRPIGIPTAERFLYLPLLGIALWAGPVLARGRRLAPVLLGALFLLTFDRSLDWRSNKTLWEATAAEAVTPRSLGYQINQEFEQTLRLRKAAEAALPSERPRLLAEVAAHAQAADDGVRRLIELYEDEIRLPLGPNGARALKHAGIALLVARRPLEARSRLDRSLKLNQEDSETWFHVALALKDLGAPADAALNLEEARKRGFPGLSPSVIAQWWNDAAAQFAAAGRPEDARRCYDRSWSLFPDPERNRTALEGRTPR